MSEGYTEYELQHAITESIEVDFDGAADEKGLVILLEQRGYDRGHLLEMIRRGTHNGVIGVESVHPFETRIYNAGVDSGRD